MRKIASIAVFLVIFLGVTWPALAADEGISPFSLKARVSYLNGTVNQVSAFGLYQINSTVGIGPWVYLGATTAEADLTVKFNFGQTGLWIQPVLGLIWQATKGDATHLSENLMVGYNHPWLEAQWQNYYYDARIDTAPEAASRLFERAWAQVGNPAITFSRVGAQLEATLPQKPQNLGRQWQRSTVYIGPRISLMKGPVRLDVFYGIPVSDPTPKIKRDTKPNLLGWLWWNF